MLICCSFLAKRPTDLCGNRGITLKDDLSFCGVHKKKCSEKSKEDKLSEHIKQQVESKINYTDDDMCPICYEDFNSGNGVVLHCKHSFHLSCITKWLSTETTCPYCRTEITIKVPYSVDEVIDDVLRMANKILADIGIAQNIRKNAGNSIRNFAVSLKKTYTTESKKYDANVVRTIMFDMINSFQIEENS